MIPVSPVLLVVVGVSVLALLALYSVLRTNTSNETEREIAKMRANERKRIVRMAEMRAAYKLAKEELGEEPTVDQIFLTRDSLREDDNGPT